LVCCAEIDPPTVEHASGSGSTQAVAHQSSLPAKAGDEPAQERGSHDGPEAKASTPPSINVVDLTGDDGGEGKEEEGKGEGGTEATNQPEGKHHACLTSVTPQMLLLI
jgi:hypothetical protein